jgi:hypothetical protein
MAVRQYELLLRVPADEFDLAAVVVHFDGRRVGARKVRAELAAAHGRAEPSGFRVFFGTWVVVGWLDAGRRSLALFSDPDPGGTRGADFRAVAAELRTQFGVTVLSTRG